jgi:hypothetical protein
VGSGDSYSAVGYQVDGARPSDEDILGNPPYPGYTTAGGPNWVLFFDGNVNSRLTILLLNSINRGFWLMISPLSVIRLNIWKTM